MQLPHLLIFSLKQTICGLPSHNFHHLQSSDHEIVSQTCLGDAYSLAPGRMASLSRSSYTAWIEWDSPHTARRLSFTLSLFWPPYPIEPILTTSSIICHKQVGLCYQFWSPRALACPKEVCRFLRSRWELYRAPQDHLFVSTHYLGAYSAKGIWPCLWCLYQPWMGCESPSLDIKSAWQDQNLSSKLCWLSCLGRSQYFLASYRDAQNFLNANIRVFVPFV